MAVVVLSRKHDCHRLTVGGELLGLLLSPFHQLGETGLGFVDRPALNSIRVIITILVTKREARLPPRQSSMAESAQRDPVSKNIWVALIKRMGSGMAQLSGGQQEARGVQRQHRGHWRRRRSAGSAQVLPAAPGAEHRQGWIAETGKDKTA
jgi:hypothetical protein